MKTMRKIFLMAAVSMIMFACSNEKEKNDLPTPGSGQVFELSAVNELTDGIVSRTRPVYSQEAIQEVERVNVQVFQNNGTDYVYLKTYNVPGWIKGSTFMRFTVPDNDKLAAGDYEFLVVGQEATDNYTLTTPVAGTTKIGDVTATITAPGNESEIFAGLQSAMVTSEGVRVSMQMTRKVAGVLGYFKNVPAILNNTAVKYLRLTVSNADTKVELANGVGTTPTGTTYNIIDADLSGQTVTAEGVYAGNDLTAQGVVKLVNSQLYGRFLLPVGAVTMTLGLYDTNNNPLKTWTVVDGASSTLNLTANHFYSLGRKVNKGDTTGGGTPDPGDDDSAIDLLKDQVIIISIDPNWNTIHNLVIQ